MKNNAISITRVAATLMIILCHLASWLNINILAMFFNVGVEIFLLISGYLYANRNIQNPCLFLKKRWIKLCIPMYIVCSFLMIYNFILLQNFTALKMIPTYIFNLQGLSFFIDSCQLPQFDELGQLWFLSIIMICYVLLALIKRIESESFWKNKLKVFSFYSLLIVVGCLLSFKGIQISYFIVFFIGYAIGKFHIIYTNKTYSLLTIGMILSIFCRLLSRHLIDGTIFYNNIIVIATHTVLAIWIYATIQMIYTKFQLSFDIICNHKIWIWIEENSMMFYMTHYMFLVGCFNVKKLNLPLTGQLFFFVVFTVVSSNLLSYISEKIISKLS